MQELTNKSNLQDIRNLITKKEYLIQAKKDFSSKPNLFTIAQKEIWDMEIAILEDEIKILKSYEEFLSYLETATIPSQTLTVVSEFNSAELWVDGGGNQITKITSINTNQPTNN